MKKNSTTTISSDSLLNGKCDSSLSKSTTQVSVAAVAKSLVLPGSKQQLPNYQESNLPTNNTTLIRKLSAPIGPPHILSNHTATIHLRRGYSLNKPKMDNNVNDDNKRVNQKVNEGGNIEGCVVIKETVSDEDLNHSNFRHSINTLTDHVPSSR